MACNDPATKKVSGADASVGTLEDSTAPDRLRRALAVASDPVVVVALVALVAYLAAVVLAVAK